VEAIKGGENLRLDIDMHTFADKRDVVTQNVLDSLVSRSQSIFEAWVTVRGLTYAARPRR
jgi:hypothetical protein